MDPNQSLPHSSHMPSSPQIPSARFNAFTNPYKAQRRWPPDFSKMDPKAQFALERRYRRRMKMVYTRPRWQRGVKLVQYLSVAGVTLYAVMGMDWGNEKAENPFEGVRSWLQGRLDSMWTVRGPTQPSSPGLNQTLGQGGQRASANPSR